MTDTEMRIAIAEACGVANRWFIMKRGRYYRPNACGYTSDIKEAWIVTEEEANKHVYPHDEPVTKHRAPLPDYPNDLNACHEMEKVLTQEQQESFVHNLVGLICNPVEVEYGPLNLTQADILWMVAHATGPQRAEALLRTLNLWTETPERKTDK